MENSILTVGHGTLPAAAFATLVGGAGLDVIVDVRSISRKPAQPTVRRR